MDRMCRRHEENLVDLMEGSLDERNTSIVLAHLAGCPTCTLALQRMQEARAALAPVAARRRAVVADPDLSRRIMDRIHREAAPRRVLSFPVRSAIPPMRRYAPMAAGFAILLAVGVLSSILGSGTMTGLDFTAWTPKSADRSTPAAGQDAESAVNTPSEDVRDMKGATGFQPDESRTVTLIATEQDVRMNLVPATESAAKSVYDSLAASGDLDGSVVLRAYLKDDGSLLVLMLLPSDTIQDRADRLSETLATCASPFRIEIIDAKDIGSRLSSIAIADADELAIRARGENLRMIALDIGR